MPKDLTEVGDNAFYSCQFRGSLQLPENVTIIGASAFRGNLFSGELKLPPALTVIGEAAFRNNPRLTGVVELPEELISVSEGLFAYCSQLEGVIIPKNVENIRANAFNNCSQLNSIVCEAQNPPQVDATAFNGVAKDNFTVEVPEASVSSYSTAPVWREFKRFAAHHDFSISRNLFRTLNASLAKTLVLRAPSGEAWSQERI